MKTLIAAALCATLVGCNEADNPTQSSYTEPQVGLNGLTLLPSANMWVSFEEVISIYKSTMACMGQFAPPPTVQYFKTAEVWAVGYNAWGYYAGGTKIVDGETVQIGMVTVNTAEQQGLGFPLRSKDTDTQVLKHEFVHHILFMNGNDHRDGYSPESFAHCGNGVNVNN